MTDPLFDVTPHVDTVTELVRRAGSRSLAWYRRLNRVENKASAGFDPVTEADRAVESELRLGLGRLFPDHAVHGEEFGSTGDGRCRWTIDPIDGTRSFITGQPLWGTLLGLQLDGQPVAGWMYLPVLDEMYVGHALVEPPVSRLVTPSESLDIAVSTTTDLAEAILACTHPTMFAPGFEAEGFARVTAAVKMTRYSGDCLNYGLLAAGLVDLVVENQLAPYDIIPLIPIVEAAGGIVTDLDGRPPLDGGFVIAAATAELHEATVDLLRGA